LKKLRNYLNKPRSWQANYAAVLAVETLGMLGFTLALPVIPLFLEQDIHVTDQHALKVWVGVIQSSSALALAICAPIWGHLADIFSRRLMLLRAMGAGAIIMFLQCLATRPWHVLVLRIAEGVFTGTVTAATVLTVAITPMEHVAMTLGLLTTGVMAGNSLGPILGGVLADFAGHRFAFFIAGVVTTFCSLVILFFVQDDKPSAPARLGTFHLLPDLRPVAHSPTLIALLIVTFSVQVANSTASPTLPLFLEQLAKAAGKTEHYVGSATGLVLGIGSATMALAAVLVGKYSGKLGYWRCLIISLAAGAVFTVPQTFAQGVANLAVFRGIAMFFIGAAGPTVNAIIAVTTKKENEGSIYGINSAMSSVGGALGPMLGSLLAMFSYRMVFLGTALLLALATVNTVWRRKGKY
jgi:DHA1 family multidrug resistance protein-like MFS transporter